MVENLLAGRHPHAAPSTIDRQLGRLGRHCLLYHTPHTRTANPLSTIAIDGLVSFDFSRFFPYHHHLAVDPGSDLLPYFTDSEVHRSGTMQSWTGRPIRRFQIASGRKNEAVGTR